MRAIGLDIGSSSIKAGVLDLDRMDATDVRSVPFPDPIPAGPLRFEISVSEVLSRVEKLLDDLRRAAPDCRDLLCTTQMNGIVIADAKGDVVSNYISWRDQRATETDAKTGQPFM